MKIERLYLKAYGAFSERCLDFAGGPDFHVIYGPNEAGKSTTLRALVGLLFGIGERTIDNFVHPHPQLRVGAVLATASNGRLAVMRRKARKQTLFALDEASGEEQTDRPLAEDTLLRVLGGLDEGLYRALFGLDLDGLTRGSETLLEGKGEIGQSLFAAAAGLADLRQLSGVLNAEADKLFLPRATTKTINIALRQLDEQRKRARDATVRSSAWEQAERLQRQTGKKHADLRAELINLREEQRRLSRVVAHLPLVAERTAKRQELATLAAVPLLPLEARQQRIETEERLRAAEDSQREARAALENLQQQRATLQVRKALLAHASPIERLRHGAKDYRGALERLPRIEAELAAVRQTLAARLAEIDPALVAELAPVEWPERIRALLPSPTTRARVEALMKDHDAWLIKDEQLEERERTLVGTLQRLRDEREAQPPPVPFDILEAAREQAAAPGDLAGQHAQLAREITELAAMLAREAAALWDGALDELIALRVPLLATVNEIGDRYRQCAEEERSLADQDRILQRDLGERERELRALAAAGEIVTHDHVSQARQRRDDGWRRIRQAYIERTADPDRLAADYAVEQPLPAAFEAALREADRLADLLHADAKRAANVESLRQRIAAMREERTALAQRFAALALERGQLDTRWAEIAHAIHRPDLTPGAAAEWLQKQALLVERSARLETLRREQREVAVGLAATRQAFDQALRACGLPGLAKDEALSTALGRAKMAIEQGRRLAAARGALEQRSAEAETELRGVAEKRAGLAEKRAAWREQWQAATAALRLPSDALPAEARVCLDQWDQLAKTLNTLETLANEARKEQSARSAFAEALANLAQAVAEPIEEAEADQVAFTLYNALGEARDADQRRQQLDDASKGEQRRLNQAETAAANQRDRLAELARQASVEAPDQLAAVEEDSARKRRLTDRVVEIEEQLVRGAACPLDQVLAEVEGVDLIAANARLDELEALIRERETGVEAALAADLDARRAFDAIDGGDAAAAAQQEAEETTERIARQARAYARARLAGAIVARVAQAYRERHQGPVLRRASEIFARITGGSFGGLVLDYEDDRQMLLGQRPDGARLEVVGMSQGTRDQLFLALRLAAIEEHLREREAVPIVIDDLLVQFDDDRAAATLEVLAELARRTQVLFFTHHGHLCELATATLAADAWRRHELSVNRTLAESGS
ncbi:MAG: AAA family ATPase [Candidatus Competibacteraceae bacterium]